MDSDDSFATANDEWPESGRTSKRQSLNLASMPRRPSDSSQHAPSKERFYRPAKALPYELINHTYVYFDGQSYTEALGLLTKLLEAGTSVSYPQHIRPAFVPPAQQIALAATLIVYPDTTTRTRSSDFHQASNQAFKYLRTLNKIVGPLNADFASAFAFSSPSASRNANRPRGNRSDGEDSDADGDSATQIRTKIANKGSLFAQTESIWNVIGWAFNCSILHKKRWERWKLFLELLLDILEDDWDERMRIYNQEVESGKEHEEAVEIITQSLICEYLQEAGASSRQGRRKMLRAIFADGKPASVIEFGEVWKDETRAPKKEDQGDSSKKRKIDVEAGDFGDYDMDLDDENDYNDATHRRSGRQPSRQKPAIPVAREDDPEAIDTATASGSDIFGGVESLRLRQRFLAFVSLIPETALIVEDHFTSREDLFDTIGEFFRSLPCSVFTLLLSTSQMAEDAKRHLHTNLLVPHLPVYPKAVDLMNPSLADLEEHLLPQPAKSSSISDNAKVSLLLESLLGDVTREMLSDSSGRQQLREAVQSGALKSAVEKGIQARKQKANGDGRRKDKGTIGEEAAARTFLETSAERLSLLMTLLETRDTPPSRERSASMLNLDPDHSDSPLSELPPSSISPPPGYTHNMESSEAMRSDPDV